MAATCWRTKPEYRGHVADGWYCDSTGRLRYRPAPDVADVRERLAQVFGTDTRDLNVYGYAIGGRLPEHHQVEAVKDELRKAPAGVLAAFRRMGGKVEVLAGLCAGEYPTYNGSHRERTQGFYRDARPPLIVLAADARIEGALHELGHFTDRGCRFSSTSAWRDLVNDGLACGSGGDGAPYCGPFAGLHNAVRNPAEAFAEAFMLAHHSSATREHLNKWPKVARYIAEASA